ncbi:50S ribosomal protein L10 [Candidatus Profftia lariciata]|uniref:50S ribosomal protein L10 n=1 Tax=Candidatus Profftia lariciata TaxID=1987921 RepID=UPI001D021D44|nr:50S ribosomal protein L10 [Candidatus Profftia lariciata]UDG81323.1 50S ribosomal protein L10 [Candidatus Profftia lariciata]
MALNLQDKKAIIAEVIEVTKSAHSAVIANSCGITVDKMTQLRKIGRESGVYMRVVRNTLMRRVVVGTPFECLTNQLIGPTLVAFSMEYPGAAARLFKNFMKAHVTFKIKAAAFNGKLITGDQIDYLAAMPTYKEAIACFIAVIKEASVGKLLRTFTALCDQKKVT